MSDSHHKSPTLAPPGAVSEMVTLAPPPPPPPARGAPAPPFCPCAGDVDGVFPDPAAPFLAPPPPPDPPDLPSAS